MLKEVRKININPFPFKKCDIPVHVCLEDFALHYDWKKGLYSYVILNPIFWQVYLDYAKILHLIKKN